MPAAVDTGLHGLRNKNIIIQEPVLNYFETSGKPLAEWKSKLYEISPIRDAGNQSFSWRHYQFNWLINRQKSSLSNSLKAHFSQTSTFVVAF